MWIDHLYMKLGLNHGSPFCLRSSQLASHWTLSLVPPRIRFLQTSLPIFYGQNNANKGIFQDENWLRQQFFDMLLTWEQSYNPKYYKNYLQLFLSLGRLGYQGRTENFFNFAKACLTSYFWLCYSNIFMGKTNTK